jgi:hypothetical protein
MYDWPLSQIQANWDQPVEKLPEEELRVALTCAGVGPSLVDFLVPLYGVANGATFFDGAIRILPFEGFKSHGFPGLLAWNDPKGWKQFEEPKLSDTFYFCVNAFGDLFGIPVSEHLEIVRDRIGMLWVERYEYQEAGVEWRRFFSAMFDQPDYAKYFARLHQYQWVVKQLGKPAPWQSFSSNVPVVLGGPNTVENISIQSLPVHASFTLQLLKQWKENKLVAGKPLPMIELYDENGNLIR